MGSGDVGDLLIGDSLVIGGPSTEEKLRRTRSITAYMPSGGTLTFTVQPNDESIVTIAGASVMLNRDGASWLNTFSGNSRFLPTSVIGFIAGTTFTVKIDLNESVHDGETIYVVAPTGSACTAVVLVAQREA